MADPTPLLIVESLIAAVVYSMAFYAKNRMKKGEKFDLRKAAPTLIIGIGVGLAYALSGVSPTPDQIALQLAELGGVTLLVQTLLQAIYESVQSGQPIQNNTA